MHGLELRSGICIFTLWPMSEVSLSVVVSSCRARTVIVTCVSVDPLLSEHLWSPNQFNLFG